jgi:hypothetical protein
MSVEEALLVAGILPDDHDAFRRWYRETDFLRSLPKAHLHLHPGAANRPVQLKNALAEFNRDPSNIKRVRENWSAKAAGGNEKIKAQMPLVEGDALEPPQNSFWHADGSLKFISLAEWDTLAPNAGMTGFNDPSQLNDVGMLWHGMGGSRDIGAIAAAVGLKSFLGIPSDIMACSEDARAEGIRWVEFFAAGPRGNPDKVLTEASFNEWREQVVPGLLKAMDQVPEVGYGLTLDTDHLHGDDKPNSSRVAQYAKIFCELYQKDDVLGKRIPLGVGQGPYDPADLAEAYAIFAAAGIRPVTVHCGEWSPHHSPDMTAVALKRMNNAIEAG